MGFIPQINTKTLYAYLTPKGREYILEGDKQDFQIAYFTLHDDDVNYFVSSNISAGTTSKYLTLPSGFVPDITGDADTCIKSIAEGTNVNLMSSLSGSTIIDPLSNRLTVGQIGTDGNINTRLLTISGPSSKSIVGGSISNGNNSTSISVVLSPPDPSPVTNNEITNTQFYIEITNAANITDISINSIRGAKVLIKPISSTITVSISFNVSAASIGTGSTPISFTIKIIPFRSFLNIGNNLELSYSASVAGGGGGFGNTG
jgi:hypothetical protein